MSAEGDHVVFVIDSSALIDCKRDITAKAQWGFFEQMKSMVQNGIVCFPKQVADELNNARHIDIPEAWTLDAFQHVQFGDPKVGTVAEVMRLAGNLVDADAEAERADPYVVAQAVEIQRSGRSVCVVTNDCVDRLPIKISVLTACQRFKLPCSDLPAFFHQIGFDPKIGTWSVK